MRPTGFVSRNSLSKYFRFDSASFWTTSSRYANTIKTHTSTAASRAEPNGWATRLDEIVHNVEHAGNSKTQIRSKSVTADFPTITIGREESKSHLQSIVQLAVEAARRGNRRGLVEEPISDVFTAGYYAVTEDIKDSFFSFNHVSIANTIRHGVLNDTLSQNLSAGPASLVFLFF